VAFVDTSLFYLAAAFRERCAKGTLDEARIGIGVLREELSVQDRTLRLTILLRHQDRKRNLFLGSYLECRHITQDGLPCLSDG
jgi:hypothetical protein